MSFADKHSSKLVEEKRRYRMSFAKNHASLMRKVDALLVQIRAGTERTKAILRRPVDEAERTIR